MLPFQDLPHRTQNSSSTGDQNFLGMIFFHCNYLVPALLTMEGMQDEGEGNGYLNVFGFNHSSRASLVSVRATSATCRLDLDEKTG